MPPRCRSRKAAAIASSSSQSRVATAGAPCADASQTPTPRRWTRPRTAAAARQPRVVPPSAGAGGGAGSIAHVSFPTGTPERTSSRHRGPPSAAATTDASASRHDASMVSSQVSGVDRPPGARRRRQRRRRAPGAVGSQARRSRTALRRERHGRPGRRARRTGHRGQSRGRALWPTPCSQRAPAAGSRRGGDAATHRGELPEAEDRQHRAAGRGLQLEREQRARRRTRRGGGSAQTPTRSSPKMLRASISSALPAGGVGSLPRKRGEARTEESGTVVGMESGVRGGLAAVQNCAIEARAPLKRAWGAVNARGV